MPQQRWYAAKGSVPELRSIGTWALPSNEAGVTIKCLLVMDDAATPPVLYQVPVVERADAASAPNAPGAVITALETGAILVDGTADPAFTDALLALLLHGGAAEPEGAEAFGTYTGEHPDAAPIAFANGSVPATVLAGEQTNTSIIYRPVGAPPVICKIFRQLHDGENPDVELQTALARSGSPHVPASVGDIMGRWDDVGEPSGRARGHLVFAQEFLPGVEDAFRVAQSACAAGDPFADESRALGAAVAEVHVDLGELFARERATSALLATIETAWRRRLGVAAVEVPEIATHRRAIEQFYERALSGAWPELQRIHGDLHLGQVILVPGRGWKLIDFEGEPMRPMRERRQPDLPVRDVAGMLRSFDYVAGAVSFARAGVDDAGAAASAQVPVDAAARAWADVARQAFLDGYVAATGLDLHRYRDLLAAFELDKAVYEAIYERRNRPKWLAIPLRAVEVLLASGPMRASAGGVPDRLSR